MSEKPGPTPPYLPFVIVDVLFLAMAGAILACSHRPMLWWEACLVILCGALAAWSLITPVLRHDGNQQAHAQSARLADLAAELQKLEQLASHINAATLQWKSAESQSAQSAAAAKQLFQSLETESRAFSEVLAKTSDTEKSHLRLEVEKLRRSEGEWLQTLTRILDHIFALYLAAQRTGQRSLVQQIGMFQDTCRDAARRVGLSAVPPQPGEAFDPRVHQLLDNATAPENALVTEGIATGFTYQGQLIRRALVSVQPPPTETETEPSQQDDLPMTQEAKP